jgi:NADH:ubiquinone oxidoreductase subunit 2 (subunit N)
VSLYYYLLVLKAIFVDAPTVVLEPTEETGSKFLNRATVAVLAAAVIFLGVMPNGLASRILAAIP